MCLHRVCCIDCGRWQAGSACKHICRLKYSREVAFISCPTRRLIMASACANFSAVGETKKSAPSAPRITNRDPVSLSRAFKFSPPRPIRAGICSLATLKRPYLGPSCCACKQRGMSQQGGNMCRQNARLGAHGAWLNDLGDVLTQFNAGHQVRRELLSESS